MRKGGPTSFTYITPEALHALHPDDPECSLKKLRKLAKARSGTCDVCENLPAWRYADTGMCFPCTTGETDASDDYELIPGK